jgi:hypothetical protein
MLGTGGPTYSFTVANYWKGPFAHNKRILDFLNKHCIVPAESDGLEAVTTFGRNLIEEIKQLLTG